MAEKRKALVVVAHPDDETIWCGGMIIRYKSWQWTIVSMCRKDDEERRTKFEKACKLLNARCFISDLDDEHAEQKLTSLNEVSKRLLTLLPEKKFDFVFTHGNNGEYGHNRHKEVNKTVKNLIDKRIIQCTKIFFFDYTFVDEDRMCKPNLSAKKIFRLHPKELQRKKYLIEKVYGFTRGSFEELSCSNTESFQVVNV